MKSTATFLLLGSALLLHATSALAQTTWRLGVRGGANRAVTTVAAASNAAGFPYDYSAGKSALYGWQAGLVAELVRGKFALQPSLQFSQKGEKFTTAIASSGMTGTRYSETIGTNRYNWLELPINLVYTLHGDHGLQLFAGPYLALAVGGRQQGTTYPYYGPAVDSRPFDFDNQISYGTGTYNRRLDVGVNFGIGYRQGPVQVQVGYGLGLRNLHQEGQAIRPAHPDLPSYNFDAAAAYNRVAQLTGTYFFAL